MIAWAIRPRANSVATHYMQPAVEQLDGTWREQGAVILATSKAAAQAMLPVGSLLLFVSADGGEWWVPWYAPSWWWPDGRRPPSEWEPPPVRRRDLFAW